MRFGSLEVRSLGSGLGCLFMVLFSVVASVVLTVLVKPAAAVAPLGWIAFSFSRRPRAT